MEIFPEALVWFLKSECSRVQKRRMEEFFGIEDRAPVYMQSLLRLRSTTSDVEMLKSIQELVYLAIKARIEITPPLHGAASRAWRAHNSDLKQLWQRIDHVVEYPAYVAPRSEHAMALLHSQAEHLYATLQARYAMPDDVLDEYAQFETKGISMRDMSESAATVVELALTSSPPKEGNTTELVSHDDAGEGANKRLQSEKSINAWIDHHTPGARLSTRTTYILNLNVGSIKDASLTPSEAARVADSDLPEAGLDTQWALIGAGLTLGAGSPDVRVESVALEGRTTWSTHFDLHIPKLGDSASRTVTLHASEQGKHSIEVLIFAMRGSQRELWRRFRLEFESVDAALVPSAETLQRLPLAAERIVAPGRETLLRTPREWTTPPGRLTLTIFPSAQIVHVQGDLDPGSSYSGTVPWRASNRIPGLADNVRTAAESFRGRWNDYLNEPTEADVDAALASIARSGPRWNWSMSQFESPRAGSLWPQVQSSSELAALAIHGYALFDTLFPLDNPLRAPLVALSPGHRIDIVLGEPGAKDVGGVPWGMLYMQPVMDGQPIDPLWFTALRWRLAYRPRNSGLTSKALGAPDSTYGVHLLYNGRGNVADATAAETAVYRRKLVQWRNQQAVPTGAAPDAGSVWQSLATPPQPTALIYVYCQCAVGQGNTPSLQFGPSRQPTDEINFTRMQQLKAYKLADQPLVFANACTTAAADPNWASELEESFFDRGCRAFIGTETKVPIPFANRFASAFFPFLFGGIDDTLLSAGESLTLTRLFFWNCFRNMGGLFYTYLNEYELYLAGRDALIARYGT